MNAKKLYIVIALWLVPAGAADIITISNETFRDLNVAVYYDDGIQAVRATPVTLIEAQASLAFERPERKVKGLSWSGLFYDRELVFVEDAALLTPTLTPTQLKKYHSLNVGTLKGTGFYITESNNGIFRGFTALEFNARKVLLGQVLQLFSDEHRKEKAYVRVGNELCDGEKNARQKRTVIVQKAIEKIIQKPMSGKYIPTIAVVASGGGMRAAFYTTGCLRALEDSLLDTVMYVAGLSGSTWALGSWILSEKKITAFNDWLVNKFHHGITDINPEQAWWIANNFLIKYIFDQPLGFVDIYGALLANTFFSDYGSRSQQVYLSKQAAALKEGRLPIPLYTAIAAESPEAEERWWEFSPFECGSPWLGAWVAPWALNRKFSKGESIKNSPEPSFGFLMATFGLVPGITIKRMAEEAQLEEKVRIIPLAQTIVRNIMMGVGDKRPIFSEMRNFTYQMDRGPLVHKRMCKLVDAGIHFNIPYPPVSGDRPERRADIIIICDASGSDLTLDLKHMVAYAQKRGYRLPTIDYASAAQHGFSVFKDEHDPSVPIIIYVPRVVDKTLFNYAKMHNAFEKYAPYLSNFDIERCIADQACSTFNFTYTTAQAMTVSMLGTFNMVFASAAIRQAIEWVVEKRSAAPAA